MPKRTSVDSPMSVRVVLITLDGHIARAVEGARSRLVAEDPGLEFAFHVAADWADDDRALEACREDIRNGDIIFVNMLFMEDHIKAVLPELRARRETCDAMVCCISAGEIIRLTRMGNFDMSAPQKGPLALLKRLRGSKKSRSDGARQMAMLRRLPKILRFIPGKAQDVRAYFLTMQYWLSGSEENLANMVRFLVAKYAGGARGALRASVQAQQPVDYPDVGVYHPMLPGRIARTADAIRPPDSRHGPCRGNVGVLVMRSYVLSGDTAHYDAVISALEARGFRAIAAFSSGLDARPAIETFFMKDGRATVEAVVSLTGFSLVGGPAFNDARAAEEMLATLDVPYLSAQALEFQPLDQWRASARGLLPVEATMMVAIPELDGATNPMVFAGRPPADRRGGRTNMEALPDRVDMLVSRIDRLTRLRRTPRAERKVGIVLFNFPPNSGAVGTAAFLSVFPSLYRVLVGLRDDGYDVDVPEDVDALRQRVLEGNASRYGADANVHALISVDDHVLQEPWLGEIEAQWGPAPGRHQTDGRSIFVLGARFKNVFVGIQPAFGHEGDPMRLLFESGFAPTHAFVSFYRWLRQDFCADSVLHFGTHGALEFMPGKQAGLSAECWPDRLIGDLPNIYLYAANNPSEGTIAKRRAAATLVSYMTPPVAQAGLYRGLLELKESIERWRGLAPEADAERLRLESTIQAQAVEVDMADAEPAWEEDASARILELLATIRECERTLIPFGLHVVGVAVTEEERRQYLLAMSGETGNEAAVRALVEGATPEEALAAGAIAADDENRVLYQTLAVADRHLSADREMEGLLRALDGRFTRPAPGGDLARNPEVLPTGRNVHGFDPYRIPSAFAVADGARQAERILATHMEQGNRFPDSIAIVLWGTDNLKSEGGPIGQVLALIGARPRFDSYGRLCGAALVPLETLGRPRIDVVVTLSGIFRDLLPHQTRLLAEAAFLAASADEPLEQNYVRRNALCYQAQLGCDLETAALRVFSNADGAYGSNVNLLVDGGTWQVEDELAEVYTRRKSFAYGRSGKAMRQQDLLENVLGNVQLAYQNLESVELGVTTIDHYFDTLGGIGRAVRRAKGAHVPVYIGDQTRGEGTVRTLGAQVALESRARMLNPKWYESMLDHGAEGVRHIEAHITNTVGWSATTGQVEPWVYKQISQTYVLDPEMRARLARLNPKASARLANRLLEAHERDYWTPDPEMLDALREAGDELEDRLEGLQETAAA